MIHLKQQKLVGLTVITGSALALHCCKAHAKINGKNHLTPCKIVTHSKFQFETWHNAITSTSITHHATLGSNLPSGGFPPNREKHFCDFLLYCFFLDHAPIVEPPDWFLRWMAQMTCFRHKMVLLGGQDDGWRHMRKIFPKNSPKRGVNRQLQAKRQNLYIAISINPTK